MHGHRQVIDAISIVSFFASDSLMAFLRATTRGPRLGPHEYSESVWDSEWLESESESNRPTESPRDAGSLY